MPDPDTPVTAVRGAQGDVGVDIREIVERGPRMPSQAGPARRRALGTLDLFFPGEICPGQRAGRAFDWTGVDNLTALLSARDQARA